MKNGTKKNGLIGLAAMVVLSCAVMFGSDALYAVIDDAGSGQKQEEMVLKDGTYTAKGAVGDTGFNKGYKDVVNLTVTGGKITGLVWDAVDAEGKGKSQLSLDGDYTMNPNGLTWAEQSEALASYVIEQQTTAVLKVNDGGKIDSVAGVTIDISGFIDTVSKAVKEAAK